ncbi:MAG: polysaccharide biosynthesis protein [Eubacteriales bacterium]|nr:polysaccharide biosynthesis protein [Eubacteriales bacterium]
MAGKARKNKVAVQAGILVAAGFIVKIISLIYRGPLTAIIGDEGNGYYGTAYNFYTIMLIISSYSVPSAISKIMASKLAVGEYRNAQRVLRCALLYVCIVGAACGLFLYFGAGLLVTSNAVPVLRVFAPVLFLFGILGVLRGYFQAHGSMVQTSVSQVLEQLINAVISIFAAYSLMQLVLNESQTTQAVYGAIGSAIGTGAGVVVALLFMVWMYYINRGVIRGRVRRDRSHATESYGDIMKATIRVVTPFILSSFILNLTTTLNQTVYQMGLVTGMGMDQVTVTTQYGIFSQKAVVLTNIPISIATAVASAIIPTISTSYARGDAAETRSRSLNASRMTVLVSMPCAIGMAALARPITMLLFPQQESIELASGLLMVLAITVLFYSVATVTNAVLQSIGHINMPLVSAGVALAVQTLVLALLLWFTDLGVYSLAIVSVLYSALIFVINEICLHHYLHTRVQFGKVYGRPLLAALIMGALAWGVYHGVEWLLTLAGMPSAYFVNLIAVVPALAAAVLSYGFCLIAFRAVSESDLRMMPKGTLLIRVLRKLRWLPQEGTVQERSRQNAFRSNAAGIQGRGRGISAGSADGAPGRGRAVSAGSADGAPGRRRAASGNSAAVPRAGMRADRIGSHVYANGERQEEVGESRTFGEEGGIYRRQARREAEEIGSHLTGPQHRSTPVYQRESEEGYYFDEDDDEV